MLQSGPMVSWVVQFAYMHRHASGFLLAASWAIWLTFWLNADIFSRKELQNPSPFGQDRAHLAKTWKRFRKRSRKVFGIPEIPEIPEKYVSFGTEINLEPLLFVSENKGDILCCWAAYTLTCIIKKCFNMLQSGPMVSWVVQFVHMHHNTSGFPLAAHLA